ncbi:MAG: phosphonate monoester hydrolase [Rhodobacterales bacterium]|nr:MAG: phosphonate monoester hydrolase [Rhodobacterales bacterium]
MSARNTLFLVYDQLRADVLRGALAAHVPTPNFDRLAAQSRVYEQHRTAMVPCGPSRASLLTGLAGPEHGAVMNGFPVKTGTPTLGTELRKHGVEPLLFGYTDFAGDPALLHPSDPDLRSYEGVAAGFREVVEMRWETGSEWPGWLARQGVELPRPWPERFFDLYRSDTGGIRGVPPYDAAQSDTAYLTDRVLEGLEARRDHPWFAMVTYIRPHPPFVAPAPWNGMVDAAAMPAPTPCPEDHPFFDAWHHELSNGALFHGFDGRARALRPAQIADLRAVYLGLVAECDHHLGRLLDWLDDTGQAGSTTVIVTGDHGEMLGDAGLWGKDSILDPAWRVPLMIRAPELEPGVEQGLTSSTQIMPMLLDWASGGRGKLDAMPRMEGYIHLSDPAQPTRFGRYVDCADQPLSATVTWEDGQLRATFSNQWPDLRSEF